MKTFKCDYCQQIKPKKGWRLLNDYVNSRLRYCADCIKNPMAQRRMRLVGQKFDEAFWKAFEG